MKRTSIAAVLSLLVASASSRSAAAQPAPVDPYAAPAPAKPAKAAKPAKGKATPTAPTSPLDPYGLGGLGSPTTTAKPSSPLDPYAPPPAPATPPRPLPASGGAPVDPYAGPPAPKPAPGPVDPYAGPQKPAPGGAPVDPYAGPPKPAPGGAPVDPYAGPPAPPTPTVTPAPAPPTPTIAPAPTPTPPTVAPGPSPAAPDPAAPDTASPPGHLDIAAVQGLLAVQNLDGWLLADAGGTNTVARTLVAPAGAPSRRWFYLVPRKGEPTLLCHTAEAASFATLPGRHLTYSGYRDLDKAVKALLKGKKTIAMEYSPKGALPSLSRVDAGTLELVRGAMVTVKSSEVLVQFVKSTWGPVGRRSHYLAVHHLVELRKDALAFIRERIAGGRPVTELEVQERIARGMQLRGLIGPPPVVAFGVHTADPDYTPTPERAATLRRGDVVLLSLAGKVDKGIYAALSWVAVADRTVSPELMMTFGSAVQARDEALALIRDRVKRRRAVQGWEVDRAARDFLTRGGLDSHAVHRTGHSLDTDLQGSGTDLDDLEVKDRRNLVAGTGFTVGPGLYYPGELGVRAEVSVFLGREGLEVTTPAQDRVETLVGP